MNCDEHGILVRMVPNSFLARMESINLMMEPIQLDRLHSCEKCIGRRKAQNQCRVCPSPTGLAGSRPVQRGRRRRRGGRETPAGGVGGPAAAAAATTRRRQQRVGHRQGCSAQSRPGGGGGLRDRAGRAEPGRLSRGPRRGRRSRRGRRRRRRRGWRRGARAAPSPPPAAPDTGPAPAGRARWAGDEETATRIRAGCEDVHLATAVTQDGNGPRQLAKCAHREYGSAPADISRCATASKPHATKAKTVATPPPPPNGSPSVHERFAECNKWDLSF